MEYCKKNKNMLEQFLNISSLFNYLKVINKDNIFVCVWNKQTSSEVIAYFASFILFKIVNKPLVSTNK